MLFFGWEINLYSQAIGLLAGWLTGWLIWPHNGIILENTQFEKIVEKYLNIAILFRISPRFQNCYLTFNPTLLHFLHWATDVFSNGLRKYAIWVYVDKYLNVAILFRISPRFQSYIANSIRPFSIGQFFFKNDLADFLKIFPPDF